METLTGVLNFDNLEERKFILKDVFGEQSTTEDIFRIGLSVSEGVSRVAYDYDYAFQYSNGTLTRLTPPEESTKDLPEEQVLEGKAAYFIEYFKLEIGSSNIGSEAGVWLKLYGTPDRFLEKENPDYKCKVKYEIERIPVS